MSHAQEGRGHQEGKSNPWLRGTGPLADFPCRAGGTLEVRCFLFSLCTCLLKLFVCSFVH